jgi:hypothetical protein
MLVVRMQRIVDLVDSHLLVLGEMCGGQIFILHLVRFFSYSCGLVVLVCFSLWVVCVGLGLWVLIRLLLWICAVSSFFFLPYP